MKKTDFVADESKYYFKCLNCGHQLTDDEMMDAWDNLSLDLLTRHTCSGCGHTYEYYYSLDCIQMYEPDGDEVGSVSFDNPIGYDKEVTIKKTDGKLDKLKE